MGAYNHKDIEAKWQQYWLNEGVYRTPDTADRKANEMILVEFPYPSGNLHVGHWYAFAVTDIYAKYRRMQGSNVLFPIGFDAFGLPAENAAIKRGLDPRKWTYENMDTMRGQMRTMGASFDWKREVITCEPEYYKWTQWIFTQMFERGLAYRKKAVVNWDPVDKTVLANEQVMPDGTAERSGAVVEKKEIEQWFLKITAYADRLVDDLDSLDWPEQIKEMQRHWIGRSRGVECEFALSDTIGSIRIFTTRIDTIYGVTYIVLSPEHPLLETLIPQSSNATEVNTYIQAAKKKDVIERTAATKEKTGIVLDGIYAINPANKKKVPIFVADYVLADYGTGAVMAVPAHDERDYAFATKYGLPIEKVIDSQESTLETCFTGDGVVVNSDQFSGLSSEEAREKISAYVGGVLKTTYKLRDWSVGRQRYWGCPVPIVYDPSGMPHAIPQEHLPWLLPTDVDHTPTGEPPLAKSKELIKRTEQIFGIGWKPEVETLDTFVDSSWYFLRYLDPHNADMLSASDKIKQWMPVSFYSGGAEHTTLHLLYSRFFYKFLFDIGMVPDQEPYRHRLNRGLILGPDGNKMSKSKGNVIDPDALVDRLGADTVRLYLAFIGPYNEVGAYPWDTNGVVGVRRFLEKVWRVSERLIEKSSQTVTVEVHRLIQKATRDYELLKTNTVVAALMTCINVAEREGIDKTDFQLFLQILAPAAPHIAEELWHAAGNTDSIVNMPWPEYNEKLLQSEKITIAIQVNGKVRGEMIISPEMIESTILEQALALPEIQKWIAAKEIKKTLYIKGKIVNIVVI